MGLEYTIVLVFARRLKTVCFFERWAISMPACKVEAASVYASSSIRGTCVHIVLVFARRLKLQSRGSVMLHKASNASVLRARARKGKYLAFAFCSNGALSSSR